MSHRLARLGAVATSLLLTLAPLGDVAPAAARMVAVQPTPPIPTTVAPAFVWNGNVRRAARKLLPRAVATVADSVDAKTVVALIHDDATWQAFAAKAHVRRAPTLPADHVAVVVVADRGGMCFQGKTKLAIDRGVATLNLPGIRTDCRAGLPTMAVIVPRLGATTLDLAIYGSYAI